MRLNTADAAFLVGDAAALAAMPGTPPLEPFSPRVLDLFDTLSKALLSRPEARRFPDLAALAFWCRRAAMEERRKPYLDGEFRLGRGMALHIAPGNVPLNFAYSLAAGLLAGNANAVRLPSEPFPQAALVCAALEELLAGAFSDLRPYAACLRYPRESGLTEALSALCDARIIWGGDETVRRVRAFPLKPRAAEICFADRWSACVIDSGTYLAHALALYYDFYEFKHVLLLGRVMSGKGGDLVLDTCKAVLADEYPELAKNIFPSLPDEKFRRVGQSAAAASLPELA